MSDHTATPAEAEAENKLPEVGSVIPCKSGEAFVTSRDFQGKPHYSVCAFKRKSGEWLLSDKDGGGLRVLLGADAPKGFVYQVEITGHCKNKTCVFGKPVS